MKKQKRVTLYKNSIYSVLLGMSLALAGVSAMPALALPTPPISSGSGGGCGTAAFKTGDNCNGPYQCGSGKNAVKVSIDFGCQGASCKTSLPSGCSALLDAIFAIIRFLSIGVGVVVVASMVWAGFQYTTARSDPNAVGQAKERILNNLIALLIYIFAYAILNYVIPKGFFQ